MAPEGSRIEPKQLAALVNHFVTDSSEFLQGFARQSEAKLSELSQRIGRLEKLLQLFERKLHGLDGHGPGKQGHEAVTLEAVVVSKQDGPGNPEEEVQGPGALQPKETPAPQAQHGAFEDEKYAVYRRMHRNGVPLLAIRQRLLLDAMQDSSLDVTVLDSLDGGRREGAGTPYSHPSPASRPAVSVVPAAPPPTPAPAVSPDREAQATAGAFAPPASAQGGEEAAATGVPEVLAGPSGLAAAAAAIAQRRLTAAAIFAAAVKEAPAAKAVVAGPAFVAAVASGPQVALPESSTVTAPDRARQLAPLPALAPQKAAQVQETGTPAPPPPPTKAPAGKAPAATTAISPEAALRLRRSIVAQASDDSGQSDVSDF